MKEINPVVGWVSAYLSPYKAVEYTEERKKALVDRIRKRGYNFTHTDHSFLNYAAPFYLDGVLCVLTKQEWDEAMDEAMRTMSYEPDFEEMSLDELEEWCEREARRREERELEFWKMGWHKAD